MQYVNYSIGAFPINHLEYWAIIGPKCNLVKGCMDLTIKNGRGKRNYNLFIAIIPN